MEKCPQVSEDLVRLHLPDPADVGVPAVEPVRRAIGAINVHCDGIPTVGGPWHFHVMTSNPLVLRDEESIRAALDAGDELITMLFFAVPAPEERVADSVKRLSSGAKKHKPKQPKAPTKTPNKN